MGAAYEAVIWQGLWVPGWQLALHWANQERTPENDLLTSPWQ